MSTSPTQLTLRKMRGDDMRAAVVEHWNHHAGIRQDLFGFIDVLGVRPGKTLAIQATSKSNIAARVRKILEEKEDSVREVLAAGWEVEVWGWYKYKNRWKARRVRIATDEFGVLVAEEYRPKEE